MKKIIPLIGYYLGWIYPLALNIFVILDYFLFIRTKLSGPFDFGNDSIVGYIFYSLVFSAFTFFIYFIYYKEPLKNWNVLVNLPLYFVSVYIVPFIFADNYFFLAVISFICIVSAIVYTTIVSIKAIKNTGTV